MRVVSFVYAIVFLALNVTGRGADKEYKKFKFEEDDDTVKGKMMSAADSAKKPRTSSSAVSAVSAVSGPAEL